MLKTAFASALSAATAENGNVSGRDDGDDTDSTTRGRGKARPRKRTTLSRSTSAVQGELDEGALEAELEAEMMRLAEEG